MKIHYALLYMGIVWMAFGCSGSRNSGSANERDLRSLIQRLNKKGPQPEILADIRDVYAQSRLRYETTLYNAYFEPVPQRWDNIIGALEGLHRLYETVAVNPYLLRYLTPENVYPRLMLSKDSAAADFYRYGMEQMAMGERENARQAYLAFRKAQSLVPNYRNSRQLMEEAYEKGMVNVLINPIQYDDAGFNMWNWGIFNHRSRIQQDNLIRDLGGAYARDYPARFYNEDELRRQRLSPDLVVDLVWRNIRFDQPIDQVRTLQRSQQIEIGKDSAGRPVYQTVYASLQITRRSMQVDGTLQLFVNDVVQRKQIRWDQIPTDYRFEYEFATFSGDQRALTSQDWQLINNRGRTLPSREELTDEMLRRIYAQVLQRIRSAVNW